MDRVQLEERREGAGGGRRLDGDEHQAHPDGSRRGRLQRLASQGVLLCVLLCVYRGILIT